MCSWWDFYFDGAETAAQSTVLSNNQIERLNKAIQMYTKKYYNDCFYIISNRKANIIILSPLLSANTHLYHLNKSLNDCRTLYSQTLQTWSDPVVGSCAVCVLYPV